jgi:hypothetical protein
VSDTDLEIVIGRLDHVESDINDRLDMMEEHLAKMGRVPAPLSFGSSEHQELTHDVAVMLLTKWHDKQPAQFGSYLAEVYTGVAPNGRRPRT